MNIKTSVKGGDKMSWKTTILIGGVQGEGVASTGINLMKSLSGIGYYAYGERKFSSRIKGGNTYILITISDEPVTCVTSRVDMILAFDHETVEDNRHILSENGIIMADEQLKLDNEEIISLPLTKLAKEHGSLLMKNTCAIGFLGKMLHIERVILEESIEKTYQRKGETVVMENVRVLRAAYDTPVMMKKKLKGLPMHSYSEKALMMLTGNDAIALGALMAGCRFVAAYPITPASDVMEIMSRVLPDEEGLMIQAEDEIAAVTMCIGASYAGVRSMTATSGPGLTLMMEGLGLAGITETPLVVVDAQRSGPSTGMPTRNEQSDLASLYHAGHGEFPIILLTPSTLEECYQLTVEAFNLAEEYQCPVMILSDFNLSLSPQTISAIEYQPPVINRGLMASENVLTTDNSDSFERYALTELGISPRAFPGTRGGIHKVTGLEHTAVGRPTDRKHNRVAMMDKRHRKMQALKEVDSVTLYEQGSDVLCLTFGSNWGVLETAVKEYGVNVDIARISRIKPLPVSQLKDLLSNYRKMVVMEQNQTGQLAKILKQELGFNEQIVSFTKYDGEAFRTKDVAEELQRWCKK